MRTVLLITLFAAIPALAQESETAHRVPFAAEGNTLALTVANIAEEHGATALSVALAEAPDWLAVTPAEVVLDAVAPGAEARAAFSFDVLPHAPVGTPAALRFTVTTVDSQTWTHTVRLEVAAPAAFRLGGVYPNPFRGQTTFAYELPRPSEVSLRVYDVLGRRVGEVVDERQVAGRHEADWAPPRLASGVYLWRLTVEDAAGVVERQGKVLLIR
ncbi:MAG: T9SS type A sorting domain-containing protein [Bacteroidota bacterium]